MPPADEDMPQVNGDDEEEEGKGLVACRLEFADVIEYRLFKVRGSLFLHIEIGRIGSSSEERRLGRWVDGRGEGARRLQDVDVLHDHVHVYLCKSGCKLWIIKHGFTQEANVDGMCAEDDGGGGAGGGGSATSARATAGTEW